MRKGTPVVMVYETRFLINWPQHLGGDMVYMDLVGTMILRPMLSL